MRAWVFAAVLLPAAVACREKEEPGSCENKGYHAPCTIGQDGILSNCLPAGRYRDWSVFRESEDTSRVRSRAEWLACLSSDACNPLLGLEDALVADFDAGLQFDARGASEIDLAPLAERLSYPEVVRVLDTFGVGPSLAVEARCANNALRLCLDQRRRT